MDLHKNILLYGAFRILAWDLDVLKKIKNKKLAEP